MFKNLMTKANYENLLRDDIYLNHEDYHARMIEPLRSAFNLLAASLLYEGKVKEAGMVLDKAVYNFYAAHLKPSFANLQTADILLNVGRRQEAHRLSAAVFDSTFLQVKEELDNKEHVGQLSVLLLRRSVDLLNRSGRTEYAGKLKDLKIFD
jgi:hypothetical protein